MQTWCDTRGFEDGHIVTEDKLILWLQEIIIPRGVVGTNGNHSFNYVFIGIIGNQKLSFEGLDNYIKAIIFLFREQKAVYPNMPEIRGPNLSRFVKAYKSGLYYLVIFNLNFKGNRAERERLTMTELKIQ